MRTNGPHVLGRMFLVLVILTSCSHQKPATEKDAIALCDAAPYSELTIQKLMNGSFYSSNFARAYKLDELLGTWVLIGFYKLSRQGRSWNEFKPTGIQRSPHESGNYDHEVDPEEIPMLSIEIVKKTKNSKLSARYQCAANDCGYDHFGGIPRFESNESEDRMPAVSEPFGKGNAEVRVAASGHHFLLVKGAENEFALLTARSCLK